MYQFMGHSDFDRARLHIRFDENEVPMAGLLKLEHILTWLVIVGMMCCLSRCFVLACLPRGCTGRGEIAITAKDHIAEPFSCPAHILLTVRGNGKPVEFLRGKLQFLPVVC